MAGCTVGAPPGFSSGDTWTFPLVGPLEDGLLITPVSVRGHGPYLFAFDPDASLSAIDKQVVDESELRTSSGPHILDETDTGQVRFYAELLDLKVANLTIGRREVMVFPIGFYDTEGRHLNGILGRDVLAESLVFGFDRDQGIATLSTIKVFTPPPGATAITYQAVSSQSASVAAHGPGASDAPMALGESHPAGAATSMTPRESAQGRSIPVDPVQRRLATAQIGKAKLAMHLDLGAAVSQLSASSWATAGLAPVDVKLRLIDEAASIREVTKAGVAAEVTVGTTKTQQVTFVPYVEKRFGTLAVDGALGLDFFRAFAVYANWDSKTYYLKPRGDAAATLTARVGRWGAALPACPHPGCIAVELVSAAGGITLTVTRDAQAANRGLEGYVGVTSAAASSAALPLLVELPRGVDTLTGNLPAEYAGTTLTVVDVSPFPRTCVGEGGCVVQVTGPVARSSEPAPPGPPPAGSPSAGSPSAGSPPVAGSPAR